VIALSRTDLVDQERLRDLKAELAEETDECVFGISAPLGEGVEPLLDAVIRRLGPDAELVEEAEADERPWSPL
jgi:selenocysteine-specific translation elongation factor